ncbi:hypothetical protein IU510_12890 [Nocardia cyriacigeorgica]|uniref:hypothetical protein n=1 Tax=Nocardia cyriacigeorgica TaxID=135487 RepID=UPI0018955DE5|nr:hypothetical protein [Nocardia cyriacigeorgica]MBF6098974.1 hypothetical protein [Nocardia cyriacigeorgica]MBF6159470.1 hypothetical protein [Nocardia cyriacigeorgica]MBF6198553.1 hypothetical protein [Nocardia cyriacigeorgica]MBF6515008.1 hypothetical protein [Nocardia cyriacigeorgica]
MFEIAALAAVVGTFALLVVVLLPPEHKAQAAIASPKPKPTAPVWDTDVWVPNWPHEEPDELLTIEAAQYIMQAHRQCSRTECARKSAAWDTLVAAGRIVPSRAR